MAERLEMAIPYWSGEAVVNIVLSMVLILGTLVAILSLLFQVAIIVPCIWLALMAWLIRGDCRDQVALRKTLIGFLGAFARKHFVEGIPRDTGCAEIRFGYRLLGIRLFYLKVPLGKIETVEWSPSQAPRFWQVFIWYDHDDPEKSLAMQKHSIKPDQDIYCVGPSMGKKRIEAFGLAFVDFLCRAGATLVRGEGDCLFVRAASETTGTEERPAT